MPGSFKLKVDGDKVTVSVTPPAVVTYTTQVTKPDGTVVLNHTHTPPRGVLFTDTRKFPNGKYHIHITGSDGTTYDADFTIPTTPPVEVTVTSST